MTSTATPTLKTSVSLLFPSPQECIANNELPTDTLDPEVLKVLQKFEFSQNNQELTKQFGVFTLTAPEQPTTLKPNRVYHWVLTVDRSGSMNRSHEGGQYSRLDYVKHTLKHLLQHIVANITLPNLLSIQVFDHQSEFVVDKLTLSPGDTTLVENIYNNYILPIAARGSTDIYGAMESANILITNAKNDPDTARFIPTHIFLTDGGATSGITNENTIAEMCADHETSLLSQCSDTTGASGAGSRTGASGAGASVVDPRN